MSRHSNVKESNAVRQQDVKKIKKWEKSVLQMADSIANEQMFIGACLGDLINAKLGQSNRSKDFLAKAGGFWRLHFDKKDMNQIINQTIFDIDTTDANTPTTAFHRHFKEATKVLTMVDIVSETEIRRLFDITEQFRSGFKNLLPSKQLELKEVLKYATSCAKRERLKKKEYDKLINTSGAESQSCWSWCCGEKLPHVQSLQWHQTMAKVQYDEAAKLTDEAFRKVNMKLEQCEFDLRMEFVALLKKFIMTEINQLCKALEYFTLAYKYTKACDIDIEKEKSECKFSFYADDKSVADTHITHVTRVTNPGEMYEKMSQDSFLNDDNRSIEGNTTDLNAFLSPRIQTAQSHLEHTDNTMVNLHGITPKKENFFERKEKWGSKPDSNGRSRSLGQIQTKSSSDTKAQIEKYSQRAKDYDDLINSSVETFIEVVKGKSDLESFDGKRSETPRKDQRSTTEIASLSSLSLKSEKFK